jgi:cobyrinic acid a,c-diamide synthase
MMDDKVAIPRLVVAGTASGVGKTTAVVALTRALRARGHRVALFKCGPDYLDPTYHRRASGGESQTLDGWMMGRDAVTTTFARAAASADVAIVEGVMALYDGATPTGDDGSTAQIAKWLDAPVLLVVDAGGVARSIAALVHGFSSFDPDVRVSAVLASRVGGRGHLDLLRSASSAVPLVGGFPRDDAHAFPERHLGLIRADDADVSEATFDHWGEMASAWCDVDALLGIARSAPALAVPRERASLDGVRPSIRCRIGIARDEAFHFYYADNLARLEAEGAELVSFSPVHDTALPVVDGVLIGGGYPEAHAARLAANATMIESVRAFARRGSPIYAECGGLMYLSRAIVTLDGVTHPMVGLVAGEARMRATLQALGYVEVETTVTTPLGASPVRFRGHQFRYSELSPVPPHGAYSIRRAGGDDAFVEGYGGENVLASYVHAHWASNPSIARSFVDRCVQSGKATSRV